MKKPFYKLSNPMSVIRQFTPNWFTVNMGTGVVCILLLHFPYFNQELFLFGRILWIFNIILFSLFSLIYFLRWIIFYHEAKRIFQDNSMLFFLGAIPMGFSTIISGLLTYGRTLFGPNVVMVSEYFWYFNAFLAILVSLFVAMMMFTRQNHALNSMTAIWLLPIVAAEVVASTGGTLLAYLEPGEQAFRILIASYVLWGMSVLPAFSVLTILFLRMALHRLPEQQVAISGCLALGPIGTGALALLSLGKQATPVLQHSPLMMMGDLLHYFGIISALILLGFGIWWFAVAIAGILRQLKQGLTFSLGWWGLTFPIGVYALAIIELAQQLNLMMLATVGWVLASVVILLWLLVIYKTIRGAYQGHLFFSPCIQGLQEKKAAE